MTITIRVRSYHKSFLTAIYGVEPLSFPRKDDFNRILNLLLTNNPPEYSAYDRSDVNLEIRLPFFEDKDVRSYFHLSPTREKILFDKIDDLFKIVFRDEMDQYTTMGVAVHTAVRLFMENYRLSEDTFDMLVKDYNRTKVRRRVKKTRDRKNISSVKSRFCPKPDLL